MSGFSRGTETVADRAGTPRIERFRGGENMFFGDGHLCTVRCRESGGFSLLRGVWSAA